MKRSVSKIFGLALVLLFLLSGCGGQKVGDLPPVGNEIPEEVPEAPPAEADVPEPEVPQWPELEETDWAVVTIDGGDFGITEQPIGDPAIYGGSASLPLDQLIAFSLASDGAASEDLFDELYHRFLEAPNTVLAYLALMGDQITELGGWEPMPTAEIICRFIASTDAAMYGGTEEFTQTLASCREAYPEGRIAELLDIMEREHVASMEQNQ